MAIKNKFIHFKTRAAFNANVPNPALTADEGNAFYNYTTFIKDTKEIYTHGTFYKCDISAEEVEALVTSKGYITEDDIPVLSGGAAATSGQYVSGVTVSGHTVTVTKAALPSAATVAPKASGTAAVGTSTKYAREDHVHPSQTNVATATKLATPRVIAIAGAVSGSATFDGSTNISISTTLANIDASKITSGTLNADRLPEIPISKIPAAAMERLYVVESQSAAMSLTIQEGDVVQIGSGGPMYFCVSESASTFATKFKEFTAGSATSVPWSGVTNAPTKLSQFTNDSGFTTNKGTVTSVAMSVPTGLSISGSPITASGTLALSYTSGYSIPTTAKQTNWDTAYGWGNHASAGYLKTIPAATSSAYGGIQIGYTTSYRNYAVQLSNGKAYVNVPWTDTNITYTAGTNISISGTAINCTYSYSLPTATAAVLGGVKIGSNISVSSGTISLTSANVTSALGFTPISSNEIPAALPNPYALTINGTSYTGSSAVSVTTPKILSTTTLNSSTVSAGYSYNNTDSKTILSLSGFSASNPDSVIISTAKLTFTASNAIKMDGLADLSGTYYIYCLSYMANGKIAVNGAVYA